MYKLLNKIGFKNRRRSVFLTLLTSYILVILIPVFVGVVLYKKVEDIMIDNTNRYNLAMLEQVRQVMDGHLKEVDQLAYQISFNPKVQKMLSSYFSSEMPNNYQYIDLQKELRHFKMLNDFIYDFYIYFSRDDVILTADKKVNSSMFYNNFHKYKEIDYEHWLKMLNSYHHKTYLPSMPVGTGVNFKNTITYIHSLPYGEKKNIRGSFVVFINESNIKKLFENIKGVNSGYIYILNKENQVIMSTSNNPKIEKIKYSSIANSMDIFEQKISGYEMMISYSTSEQNGWKYISMVPKNLFMERVNRVKGWALGIILFYLVGGMVLAYIMAYKNYSPLRNLINSIMNIKKVSKGKIANEYEFIMRTILDELNEKKSLSEIIYQQMPVVKNNFLYRIIRGCVDCSTVTSSSLGFMGIDFISDYFMVLLVDIEDCTRFSEDDSEGEWALVRFILTNITSELANEYNRGYIVELEKNRLAILINFRNDRLNDAVADVENIACTLRGIVENKFNIFITIGISNVHNGISGIGQAFKEALKAIDYKIVKGINGIIYYRELKDTEQYYYYPMEIEMKLINFVKTGDYDNVEKILDDIYEENFKSHNVKIEIGQCLFFNIMSTLIKVMNSVNIKFDNVVEDKYASIRQLASCSTVEEMQVKIKFIYKNICDYIKTSQSSRRQLLERIISYIEKNYTDNMLSLVSIAEELNITPQYLSAYFKNCKGLNISDYIAELRVKRAKMLLANETLTVSEIARMVGYANDVGFIRVFKKYEGITPGKYRDN